MQAIERTATMKSIILTAVSALAIAATAMPAQAQCGKASWYALTSKTASGERMNPSAMTAAHRTLPLGTKVTVVNKRNGKSVTVRINDRGPFIKGRIIDLSKGAASKLGFIQSGHTSVCISKS
jgi:rare lipoprotein A